MNSLAGKWIGPPVLFERRRRFWCSVACLAGFALPCAGDEPAKPGAAAATPAAKGQPAADPIGKPSPVLSPEDVVRKQMQSLTGAGSVAQRIEGCYRFASPANRQHTGPIERFSAMVQAPLYQALLNSKHYLIGRVTQQEGGAYLLVSTVDPAGELSLFRFFLSKQAVAPYQDCWMTDVVTRVGTMKIPEKPRDAKTDQPTT